MLDCFPRRAKRVRRRPRARSGKIQPLLFRSRRRARRRPRLLSTRATEHDDDHEHDQEKSRRFFIVLVLVLVVVLDRSHRRANRARRRPRARPGNPPLFYRARARSRRRARSLSPPGRPSTTTTTSTTRKSSAYLSSSSFPVEDPIIRRPDQSFVCSLRFANCHSPSGTDQYYILSPCKNCDTTNLALHRPPSSHRQSKLVINRSSG